MIINAKNFSSVEKEKAPLTVNPLGRSFSLKMTNKR